MGVSFADAFASAESRVGLGNIPSPSQSRLADPRTSGSSITGFASKSECALLMSFDISGGARWVICSAKFDLSPCGVGKNLECVNLESWGGTRTLRAT